MADKIDLKRMLAEIREDEAVSPRQAVHLSQNEIEELLAKRKTQGGKPLPPSPAQP